MNFRIQKHDQDTYHAYRDDSNQLAGTIRRIDASGRYINPGDVHTHTNDEQDRWKVELMMKIEHVEMGRTAAFAYARGVAHTLTHWKVIGSARQK